MDLQLPAVTSTLDLRVSETTVVPVDNDSCNFPCALAACGARCEAGAVDHCPLDTTGVICGSTAAHCNSYAGSIGLLLRSGHS